MAIKSDIIFAQMGSKHNYYPYRAFGGPKNRVFHALCDREGNNIIFARAL